MVFLYVDLIKRTRKTVVPMPNAQTFAREDYSVPEQYAQPIDTSTEIKL
jgi:hypothetical protein